MYGPTCIFWANLTPFSLKGCAAELADLNADGKLGLDDIFEVLIQGETDRGFRGLT